MVEQLQNGICFSRFAVDEKPYCAWEWDLPDRNLRFLKGIDPAYYHHLADAHEPHLESDQSKSAALAIRVAYSQALETFFALLAATIQAPDCVFGWLLRYGVEDLRSVVRKIDHGKPILTNFNWDPVTWATLSKAINQFKMEDPDKLAEIQDRFASLWRRLSRDLTEDLPSWEYNSIKHGLRARSGGFAIAIGREDVPGIPAPPEKMKMTGGSEFGSSFYAVEGLETGGGKRNFRARSHSRNWVPKGLCAALHLIAGSITNVLSFLKQMHGVSVEELRAYGPKDLTYFDAPWAESVGVTSSSMDSVVTTAQITPFSKDEILAVYQPTTSQE